MNKKDQMIVMMQMKKRIDENEEKRIDKNDSMDVVMLNPCGSARFVNFDGKNALQFKLNETGCFEIPSTELDAFGTKSYFV